MKNFNPKRLSDLFQPEDDSSGEDNGQVTIIGGSSLFHGAPILSLKVASRIVDMVFFASPDPSVGKIAEKIKSELMSFIWVPWEEVDAYIEKSDAVLTGPGFMRYKSDRKKVTGDKLDDVGKKSRGITKSLFEKFPDKKWVIDAGSLQTMEAEWIPEEAIITPNRREYQILFGGGSERLETRSWSSVQEKANKYNCTIVLKGPETVVASPEKVVKVTNGNAGLTKGGTGDVLAGLTVALFAKNDAHLAASAASYVAKAAADELYKEVGTNYNADDLAEEIPKMLHKLTK